MALQKSKTLANGSVGNYWKTTRLFIDPTNGVVNITMELYTSEAYKDIASLRVTKQITLPMSEEQIGPLLALSEAGVLAYANTIKTPEVLAVTAVEADSLADPPIEAVEAVAHAPAVYMEPDLAGAVIV